MTLFISFSESYIKDALTAEETTATLEASRFYLGCILNIFAFTFLEELKYHEIKLLLTS